MQLVYEQPRITLAIDARLRTKGDHKSNYKTVSSFYSFMKDLKVFHPKMGIYKGISLSTF